MSEETLTASFVARSRNVSQCLMGAFCRTQSSPLIPVLIEQFPSRSHVDTLEISVPPHVSRCSGYTPLHAKSAYRYAKSAYRYAKSAYRYAKSAYRYADPAYRYADRAYRYAKSPISF